MKSWKKQQKTVQAIKNNTQQESGKMSILKGLAYMYYDKFWIELSKSEKDRIEFIYKNSY